MAMHKTAHDDLNGHIDRVTYLASLVSNKKDIEPYLNELRMATSWLEPNAPAGGADKAGVSATLHKLESELRDYLVHKEPLRAFTDDSIEQRLYERQQAGSLIRRLRWQMVALIVFAAVFAAGILSLPPIADSGKRSEVVGTTFITGLYFGAVYLFLSCLKQFSPAVRAAYRLFAFGFVAGATTVLASVCIVVAYATNPPWQTLWFTTLGFPVSYVMFYFASRRLAQMQRVKSAVLNWPLVGLVAVVCASVVALLPGGRSLYEIDGISSALCVFTIVLIGCYNWALFRAWHQSTERYQHSMRALTLSTFSGLIGWILMTPRTFVSSEIAVTLATLSDIFSLAALIFLLRAGYLLNKLSRQ